MKNKTAIAIGMCFSALLLSGCETTNSIPYKASTSNVIAIQQALQPAKVSVADIKLASGVEENPLCRLMGPVKVAPGKTLPQYIKEALQEELFLAQAYDTKGPAIEGSIDELSFSSVAPANWKISMTVKSAKSAGYKVSVNFPFETSFTAISACKNVADAFGPAVQELLKQVVTNPQFATVAGK
ncbi:hypothetical protein [Pandoraea pnomenusa]|uniref:hypothetical protein n=1 Tax=Pandoraea pnomenusa TaxID=93220 RepID=UPI003340EB88